MGSWPSVARPPEVAELSRISVFGCGGGATGWSLFGTAFFAFFDFAVSGWPLPCCRIAGSVGLLGTVPAAPLGDGAVEGVCAGGFVDGELGGCGFAKDVCGVPEASFGSDDPGCCCAHRQTVSNHNAATSRNGERYIGFCIFENRLDTNSVCLDANGSSSDGSRI